MNNLKNLKNFQPNNIHPVEVHVSQKPQKKPPKKTKINKDPKKLDKNSKINHPKPKYKNYKKNKNTQSLSPSTKSFNDSKNKGKRYSGLKGWSILLLILSILILGAVVSLIILMDNFNRHNQNITIGLMSGSVLFFIIDLILLITSAKKIKNKADPFNKISINNLYTSLTINIIGIILASMASATIITTFLSWFVNRI